MRRRRPNRSAAVSEALITGLAEHYGLTVRAIRHYEQVGLVATYRDHANRRKYDALARARLELISRLRTAGLALKEFAPIVELDQRGRAAQLRAAAEALKTKLAELDLARDRLVRTIAEIEGELAPQGSASDAGARLAAGHPGGRS